MKLKEAVNTILNEKVALYNLQQTIKKMEAELVMQLVNEFPEALSIDYNKICRMVGLESLRHRLINEKKF